MVSKKKIQFNLDDQTENGIVLNDERDIEFESFEAGEEVILKGCEKGCTYGSLRGGKVDEAEKVEEVGNEGNKDVKKGMQLSDSGEDGKSKQAKDESGKTKEVNADDDGLNFGKGSDKTNKSMGCGMQFLKEETSGTNEGKLFLLREEENVENDGVAIEALDLYHKNKDYVGELEVKNFEEGLDVKKTSMKKLVEKNHKGLKQCKIVEDESIVIAMKDDTFYLDRPVVSPSASPHKEEVEDADKQIYTFGFDGEAEVVREKNVMDLGNEWIESLAGSGGKGKGKKQPAKAGGSRQTMIPRSPPGRVEGGRGVSAGGLGVNQMRMLSPVKKGKFAAGGKGGQSSNLYCIRIKHQQFLVVFTEDGMRQMNYRFPGSQRKAWCTAFDRDLRNESAWSSGEVCPISSIVRRRDIREEGDVFLSQRTSVGFPMAAYLCPLDVDDTPAGISNQIVTKLNEYASNSRNNMKTFRYIGEITEQVNAEELHALDYWVMTRDIVTAIASLYEEEIDDGSFYTFEGLVDGLFERPENTENVRETMARNM